MRFGRLHNYSRNLNKLIQSGRKNFKKYTPYFLLFINFVLGFANESSAGAFFTTTGLRWVRVSLHPIFSLLLNIDFGLFVSTEHT